MSDCPHDGGPAGCSESYETLRAQLAAAEARAKDLERLLSLDTETEAAVRADEALRAELHLDCHARTRRAVEAALAKAAREARRWDSAVAAADAIGSLSPDSILRGLDE